MFIYLGANLCVEPLVRIIMTRLVCRYKYGKCGHLPASSIPHTMLTDLGTGWGKESYEIKMSECMDHDAGEAFGYLTNIAENTCNAVTP